MSLTERSNEIPVHSAQAKGRMKLLFLAFLFGGTLLLVLISTQWQGVSEHIGKVLAVVGNNYQRWFEHQNTSAPIVLLPLAFLGGLLSSFSPCILPMLPINLSYIGTLKIESRWDALKKSSLFVLGAATALSAFGLFSSLSAALFVDHRGPVDIAIGSVILTMGLSMAGLFRLPLPCINLSIPNAGPYGVGLTFALVTSPCASPVLFAVLAAGASTGSQAISILAMIGFALGYTALIFFASLFAGLAKQTRSLLGHTDWIPQLSSAVLVLAGGYYLISGIRWFF
jgi:cytochrome c-type biogenesis protein